MGTVVQVTGMLMVMMLMSIKIMEVFITKNKTMTNKF